MRKSILVTVLVTFVVLFACAGTPIPKTLVWEHSYTTTGGTPIDSTDLDFQIYVGDSLNFQLLATTIDTSYYLLSNEELYTDSLYFFYLTARRISTNTYSASSDTVNGFFPVLVPSKAYEFQILKISN